LSGIESIIGLIITTASGGDAFNWIYVGKHTVNLAILLGVLAYFLKAPIKNFLIERRVIMSSKIEESKKEITEAKSVYDRYIEKMNNLENEITDLKQSIKNDAEIERQGIIKQAEISAIKIREDAREMIKAETAKAKNEIQNEVVNLAIELAENLIKSNLNESDSKRIVEDFVEEVNETKWQQ